MVLDRALAEAEVGGNIFAGMPCEHESQDLVLTGCEASEAHGGV
jgi:hypothetical protein